MKIISFPEKETESIKAHLVQEDIFHTIKISSEYGNYKKGEFVKTSWGERFVIIDIIQIKNIEQFKREYVHYKELKNTNLEEIKKVINYKKIEILKLKKVDNNRVY
jgi:hypothetical protein